MLEPIDIAALLKIERVLQESAAKGNLCMAEVLSIIKDYGFYSCFYYVAVPNISVRDYKLILSDIVGTASQKFHIGEGVNYKSSAIYFNPDKKSPIKQCIGSSFQTEELIAHTKALEVYDKNRVHAPIYYGEELIGALSCSWQGDCDLLKDSHKQAILLITSLISRYWALAKDELIQQITTKIFEDIKPSQIFHNIDVLIEKIAASILPAINARIVSIFRYNWYSDTLTKVAEAFASSISGKTLNEVYSVGDKLTGTAWQKIDFRLISDFKGFIKSHNFHVCTKSLNHHESILADLCTVLYCPLGNKSRYLIRLMNREDDHKMPFLISHKIVMDKISERLGRILDDAITDSQLSNLQVVSKSVLSNIRDYSRTIEIVRKSLREECVDVLGVMAYEEKYSHFNYKYFSDKRLHDAFSGHIERDDDKFYIACTNTSKDDVIVLRISDFDERFKEKHLLFLLKEIGVNLLVVVPFSVLRINGFLLIPAPINSQGNALSCRDRIPKYHISSLKAYAAVIGGIIESAESHLTSENARRLVGQIGHEIQGPIAELGQSAIDVIYKMMEYFKNIQSGGEVNINLVLESLLEDEDVVDKQMQQISTLMDIAVDMAQEKLGVIQVHYRTYCVYELVKGASEEAMRDLYVDYKGVRHIIKFDFNDAIKKMNDMVGDPGLINRAFVNLFRNAIKYSLPRFRGSPIEIKVYGIPQTGMNIIRVINWGIPVPINKKEEIFKAFERGDTHDKLKARRGMGLGLYIARRFLAANRASVFCASSKPTLDDPERRNSEGFETIFEVRLQHGLSTGTFDDIC